MFRAPLWGHLVWQHVKSTTNSCITCKWRKSGTFLSHMGPVSVGGGGAVGDSVHHSMKRMQDWWFRMVKPNGWRGSLPPPPPPHHSLTLERCRGMGFPTCHTRSKHNKNPILFYSSSRPCSFLSLSALSIFLSIIIYVFVYLFIICHNTTNFTGNRKTPTPHTHTQRETPPLL